MFFFEFMFFFKYDSNTNTGIRLQKGDDANSWDAAADDPSLFGCPSACRGRGSLFYVDM